MFCYNNNMNLLTNKIYNFVKSGCWEYKDIIGPAVCAIPLAVESGIFLKNAYQQPQILKKKFDSGKKFLVDAFTAPEKTTTKAKVLHVSKNIFITLLACSVAGTLAYLSIVFLPSSMAISVAMLSIFYTGKFFLEGKKFLNNLKIQKDETKVQAKKRITVLVIKTIAKVALLLTVGTVFTLFVAKPLLISGFTWHLKLPFQTNLVVFLEYASVGVLHLGLAGRSFLKKNKKDALFHLFAGALSFIFPTHYLHTKMRLHHSFYGLILMALPYRSAKFIGTLVTLDSASYFISPKRGYFSVSDWGTKNFNSYDFINVLVGKFSALFKSYSTALAGQEINDTLFTRSENKILPKITSINTSV